MKSGWPDLVPMATPYTSFQEKQRDARPGFEGTRDGTSRRDPDADIVPRAPSGLRAGLGAAAELQPVVDIDWMFSSGKKP